MAVEGLWTIQFSKSEETHGGIQVEEQMARGGIFVLTGNRMYGGGLSYYFMGAYKMTGANIELTVNATRYNEIVPGPFGSETEASLIFNGRVSGKSMVLKGHVQGDPGRKLVIEAQQRSEVLT